MGGRSSWPCFAGTIRSSLRSFRSVIQAFWFGAFGTWRPSFLRCTRLTAYGKVLRATFASSEEKWLRQFLLPRRRERSVGLCLRRSQSALRSKGRWSLWLRQALRATSASLGGALRSKSPYLDRRWRSVGPSSSCFGGSAPKPPAQAWPKGQSAFGGPRACATTS